MKKLGFIGYGNMAQAMAKGILDAGLLPPGEILVSDRNGASLEKARSQGIGTAECNKDVAGGSEILVLAVKPRFYPEVIEEVAQQVPESGIVLTIAPGQPLDRLERQFARPLKLVRTMPNTPAMVGAGMTAVCGNRLVTPADMDKVCRLLEGFGKTEAVPEYLMDTVVGVSGSSPAYVCMFVEALADAGVAEGMPRQQAYTFAAQAVMGTAKLLLETGEHPGVMKDMVCSPGGSTIEAVAALEEAGFRAGIIRAARDCIRKAREA